MTFILRNSFNNILKSAAQDKVITRAELDSIKNASQTKDEKYFAKLLDNDTDDVKIKFKIKETAITAIDYNVKIQLSESKKEIYTSSTIDFTDREIIAIPEHKKNPDGINVPHEVYRDFPNLKVLGNTLKIQDYENILIQRHVQELAKFPESVLEKLKEKGLKQIEIGNISVTDMAKNDELRELKPRNWSEGSSWNDVPGVYNPNDRTVAISIGNHGSESLSIHEVAHAIGDLFKLDKSKEMIEHHKRLFNKVEDYLKGGDTPGNRAGTEEMFAEALATLLDDGEEKAVKRFDQPLIDYIKKEVFDNKLPVNEKSKKSDIYNELISKLESTNSNTYNELINRLDT